MLNQRTLSRIALILGLVIVIMGMIAAFGSFAADESTTVENTEVVASMDTSTAKAFAAAIAIGIPACGGAIGMGLFGGKAVEGISRQPEADGKIRTSFMLGLVFIETAIIYALLVVILIIFVL